MSDRESAQAQEPVLHVLMWLSSSLVTIGQQGRDWLNLDSVQQAQTGLVATVLPWAYLRFLHSRNLLR